MKEISKITFSWWNTSLSPSTKPDQSTKEHKDYVAVVLYQLLYNRNVDVMCLCEVSDKDVALISNMVSDGYSIYNGVVDDGRKKFDLCVIYRAEILEFVESSLVSAPMLGANLYAAQQLTFILSKTNEFLALFLVHWPSRMHDPEDSAKKAELGMLLRTAVTNCLEVDKITKIIVLGDFNEEPFNKSITHHLKASRDVVLVKKQPKLLYNPFWRHMVYTHLYPESASSHGGTYYYKSDQFCKWKTFDQMMFSADFLSGKSWSLNEKETVIFSDDDFVSYIRSSKSKFDHLPILSVIERVSDE